MKGKLNLSDGDFMDLIIVTGISGAGKSTVIHAMEDIGYFCVDNLPGKLIPMLAFSIMKEGKKEKVAIVSDVRAGINPDDMQQALCKITDMGITYKLMFLDCKEDVLLTRFRLARRSHPLMNDECRSTVEAIKKEKELMEPFRQMADYVLDTTLMSLNSCKNRIFDFFKELDGTHSSVKVHCVSFGFKHGVPEDADYIFDVRSLPNPYYIEELKPLSGTDERVSGFVMSFPESQEFEKKLVDFCDFVVPLCVKDGRSQLIIAIGCTGGHHRSVTFTEILYKHLLECGHRVSLSHRDINK